MDRMERLNLLFEGDEKLRQSHTGIYTGSDSHSSVNQSALISSKTKEKDSKTNHSLTAQSDSEEGFDEYLQYFADVHKKNARKEAAGRQSNTKTGKASDRASKASSEEIVSKIGSLTIASGLGTGGPRPLFYCPAIAMSRFPYKYVPRELSDLIAKRFFDGGKFWNMSWELYYVYPPPDISSNPLLLIPATQAQKLIASINKTLQCDIRIPTDSDESLLIPFSDDGTPQPKLLGVSNSREMKDELELCILPRRDGEHLPPDGCSSAVDRSFTAFRKKMEAAVDATRKKNKASKAKRREAQIKKQQDWCRSLKRLQCYLGLLPRYPRDNDTVMQEQDERNYGLDCGTVTLPLDKEKQATFPFDREPIFISVDVESNERCHNQITEIGISTLDTRDLVGIPPGETGKNWLAKIRPRHFRISEYGHVINKDFVAGCPDRFEFGTSEWVSIKEAPKVIDSCFQPPYSVHANTQHPGVTQEGNCRTPDTSYDSDEGGGVALDSVLPDTDDSQQDQDISNKESRNIILLGHDIQADVAYLRSLGCTTFNANTTATDSSAEQASPENEPSTALQFLEALDTATLYRALKREPHSRSLGHILLDFGLTGWFLHNAGNDAYYTMQCMIGLGINSYLQFHGSADQLQQDTSAQPPSPSDALKTLDGNVDIPLTTTLIGKPKLRDA